MKLKKMIHPGVALALSSVLLPASVQADLCDAQTGVFFERASAELTPELTAAQLSRLRKITEELCQSRTDVQGEMAAPPTGFDDWFSYFMLTKQPDKAGNRRLKNLKR